MASPAEGHEQRGARRGEARRGGGKRAGREGAGWSAGRARRRDTCTCSALHRDLHRGRARRTSSALRPPSRTATGRPHRQGRAEFKTAATNCCAHYDDETPTATRRQGGGRAARRHPDVQHGLARYANSRHSLRSWRSLRERPSLRSGDKAADEARRHPDAQRDAPPKASHHQITPRRAISLLPLPSPRTRLLQPAAALG